MRGTSARSITRAFDRAIGRDRLTRDRCKDGCRTRDVAEFSATSRVIRKKIESAIVPSGAIVLEHE
jgi:hypothetical protein